MHRIQSIKYTRTFLVAVGVGLVLIVLLTRGFWIHGIGNSLVCPEEIGVADAILVENFDPNYLLFERAAALYEAGFGSRVLVPTDASHDSEEPGIVSKRIVEVMVHVARLRNSEIVPVHQIEPISLNAAYQIRDFLTKENIKSVIVVTPGFRSRRSSLVYEAVFGQAGITPSCVPVFGLKTPETWTNTWHGIQEVIEQFLKLQYYRFYVLPMQAWKQAK